MKSMLKTSLALLALTGLFATSPGLVQAKKAEPPQKEAVLVVEDNAGLFTSDAVRKAKAEFAQLKSEYDRQVTIYTMKELSTKDKADYQKVKDTPEEGKFWSTYTQALAKDDRAKGGFIFICRSPGHVHVIADKLMHDAGLDPAREKEIRDKFTTAFRSAKDKPDAEAATLRDGALIEVASYLRSNITSAKANNNASDTAKKDGQSEGRSIMGWVCIGLVVLGVLWLIIGLFRGMSGGGGGGGGGGGFFSGILGGLFGAMAGMWLYNNLFGGDHSSSYGDSGSGDSGNSGETGGGDFSGDDGAGGGWDDGGGGGGGGGGDWGGGGDGGGDF